MIPMASAPEGATKPAAGVMATRPAIAPERMPRRLGFLITIHSAIIQASAAPAVATWVFAMATPASAFDAAAEPALKPNQPTHRSEAPMSEKVRLCGAIAVVP